MSVNPAWLQTSQIYYQHFDWSVALLTPQLPHKLSFWQPLLWVSHSSVWIATQELCRHWYPQPFDLFCSHFFCICPSPWVIRLWQMPEHNKFQLIYLNVSSFHDLLCLALHYNLPRWLIYFLEATVSSVKIRLEQIIFRKKNLPPELGLSAWPN